MTDEELQAIAELTVFFDEKLNEYYKTPGKRWTSEDIHRTREERGPFPLFGNDTID